jgi:hypothetical protein
MPEREMRSILHRCYECLLFDEETNLRRTVDWCMSQEVQSMLRADAHPYKMRVLTGGPGDLRFVSDASVVDWPCIVWRVLSGGAAYYPKIGAMIALFVRSEVNFLFRFSSLITIIN